MKPIEHLTNVDKAKIIFQLFPDEIPALVTFIDGMCKAIKDNEQANRAKWDNGFIDFGYWLTLLNEVEAKIQKYGIRLNKSQRLFADQLFDGMLALFTNHCIYVYTTVREHPNRKFKVAIDLLFNP